MALPPLRGVVAGDVVVELEGVEAGDSVNAGTDETELLLLVSWDLELEVREEGRAVWRVGLNKLRTVLLGVSAMPLPPLPPVDDGEDGGQGMD
jgi:hypothetical protein